MLEHQVADWKSHKVLCKQRKKEMKEREKERKESVAAINYLLLNNPPIVANPTAADLWECMEGEVGRARQILLIGVDVNWQDQGATLAYTACQNGHT